MPRSTSKALMGDSSAASSSVVTWNSVAPFGAAKRPTLPSASGTSGRPTSARVLSVSSSTVSDRQYVSSAVTPSRCSSAGCEPGLRSRSRTSAGARKRKRPGGSALPKPSHTAGGVPATSATPSASSAPCSAGPAAGVWSGSTASRGATQQLAPSL